MGIVNQDNVGLGLGGCRINMVVAVDYANLEWKKGLLRFSDNLRYVHYSIFIMNTIHQIKTADSKNYIELRSGLKSNSIYRVSIP